MTTLKKDLILIFIFLVSSFLAIYSQFRPSSVFYFLIIIISSITVFSSNFLKRNYKIILGLLLLGILLYSFCATKINNIELWGDEVGVINVAHLEFNQIVKFLSKNHASVPPLDYWNIWLWKYIVNQFHPNVQELIYRIPYMIWHCLSAIIFAILIKDEMQKKKVISRSFSVLMSFLFFFFNPILFFYSIEIRFYSFACFGAVITLYLFLKQKLYETKYLPLLLLFSLNSIFQPIIIFPFWLYGITKGYLKKPNFLVFTTGFLILGLIIAPILFVPSPVDQDESIKLILSAAKQLWHLQIWSLPQILILLLLSLTPFFSAKARKSYFFFTSLIAFYILTISSLAFYKKYFDFYVRHYSFIIPFILYALFLPLISIPSKKHTLGITVVLFIFTLPWANDVNKRLTKSELFSKTFIGSKEIFQLAKSNDYQLIVLPNSGNSLNPSTYTFYLNTLIWYSKQYPTVKIAFPNSTLDCYSFHTKQNIILVSLSGDINCPKNVPHQERFIFNTELWMVNVQSNK